MILAINGGFFSIKFALFKIDNSLTQLFNGEIENIGSEKAKLNSTNSNSQQKESISIQAVNHNEAAENLIEWLKKQEGFNASKRLFTVLYMG